MSENNLPYGIPIGPYPSEPTPLMYAGPTYWLSPQIDRRGYLAANAPECPQWFRVPELDPMDGESDDDRANRWRMAREVAWAVTWANEVEKGLVYGVKTGAGQQPVGACPCVHGIDLSEDCPKCHEELSGRLGGSWRGAEGGGR